MTEENNKKEQLKSEFYNNDTAGKAYRERIINKMRAKMSIFERIQDMAFNFKESIKFNFFNIASKIDPDIDPYDKKFSPQLDKHLQSTYPKYKEDTKTAPNNSNIELSSISQETKEMRGNFSRREIHQNGNPGVGGNTRTESRER